MKHRTRVKFCGLSQPSEIELAVELGVDAVGVVLCSGSPRTISIERAAQLSTHLSPYVSLVALFMDNSAEEVRASLKRCPAISALQFHGGESGEFCRQFNIPYMKALPMRDALNLELFFEEFSDAQGIVVDSHSLKQGVMGGTGEAFDWKKLPRSAPLPLVLAGGLHSENVAEAIRSVSPYAVDVSSGIERSRGVKCEKRMRAFVTALYGVDQKSEA